VAETSNLLILIYRFFTDFRLDRVHVHRSPVCQQVHQPDGGRRHPVRLLPRGGREHLPARRYFQKPPRRLWAGSLLPRSWRFWRSRGAGVHVAKRFFNIVTDAPGVSVVETFYGRNIRMFVISWRLSLARLSSLVKCLREWLECNQVKQISGAPL